MRLTIKTFLSVTLIMLASAKASDETPTEPAADVSAIEAFAVLPSIRGVAVSPSGNKFSIVRSTSKEGDYIIEIRNTKDLTAEPVRLGADRMMVSGVTWLSDERILVSFRQLYQRRAEKFWVSKIAITSADGKGRWLDPGRSTPGADFSLVDRLIDDPDHVLVESGGNVIRFNVNNGRSTTFVRGSDRIQGGFVTDHDGEVRVAQGFSAADSSLNVYSRVKGSSDWQLSYKVSPDNRESFALLGFSNENPNEVYVNANLGENTTGIYLLNLETGEYSERLFGLESVDTDGLLFDSAGNLLAVTYTDSKPEYFFTEPGIESIYQGLLQTFPDGHVSLSGWSNNYATVVVYTQSARDPGTFYLLQNKSDLIKIGERMPLLQPDMLSDVRYVRYQARDGRSIPAYITIPQGEPPFPAVVVPHGGPWVRDTILFDEWAQLLAHHGYIVIQPNYRGSTGYGLEHWTAGDMQWGLAMQDDLDDAALFLVERGLADKDKLAMFGWSYGGYAAFVASMREDNIYQCAVSGAGVSDLNRINATLNDNPFLARLQRPTIEGISPRQQVEKVNIPILVIHPDIDGRVPVEHSRLFVQRLRALDKPHRYVELEDADHFYDTLFYDHKTIFYTELLQWLEQECGLK